MYVSTRRPGNLNIAPKLGVKLVPKEQEQSNQIIIPKKWQEFARMCKIRGDKGFQPFDPYEYQLKLIQTIHTHRMTVITKTRQLGFTEAIANYFLWKACMIPGYLGVVFSKGQGDTSNIARRVRLHIESLGVLTKSNALTDIEIIGGGRIVFRNSAPEGARSLDSVWDILFDEAAFCKYIEQIYTSAQPTTTVMGKKARIIILSTPNGQSGWYWDKLTAGNGDRDLLQIVDQIKTEQIDPVQVWKDEDGAAKFICHWLAHPKFSKQKETYLLDIKKVFKITQAAVEQEYNLSFEMGETLVFEPSLVRSRAIGQWEEPDPNYTYYGGLDTSLQGDDYTVFSVLKYNHQNGVLSLVAMYRARRKTHPVNMYYIGELIRDYGISKVTVETNSAGQIYYDALAADFLSVEFVVQKTTAQSKKPMINKLILAMECEVLEFPKEGYIINEFLSFRDQDGKLEASSGQHDDIVMCLAIALAKMDIDFDAKAFMQPLTDLEKQEMPEQLKAQTETHKDEYHEYLEELEERITEGSKLFEFRVKLHSNYPNAMNSADAQIKRLPGDGSLRREPSSGEVFIDSEGYAIVDSNEIEFLQYALVNQGIVSTIAEY